jgi:RHS repeat-associated protein
VRVQTAGDGAAPLALLNIKAPKNGYCYVYISNESDEAVYFDDLQVRHDRGRILEENHYYAYGLKIAALSSKAFAAPQNNYQYQGDYSEFDDDLGWNDFALRSYDPQLGRFLQHDPYDQFACGCSGMGNDPVNNVDPSGGTAGGFGAAIGFVGGSIGGWMMADNNGAGFLGKLGAAFGGGVIGAGLGYALGESINPATTFNESTSFFGNLRGFYHGVFNGNQHIGRLGNALWSPNIWGGGGQAIAGTVATLSGGTFADVIRQERKAVPDVPLPNFKPKPPTLPVVFPTPVNPNKPKIHDIDFTINASYPYEIMVFERSLSEEQSVFADGIIKGIKSKCKGVLKLSRIDVSIPTNGFPNQTLQNTTWGGSVGINSFGSRIDRFMVNPSGLRTPPDGNGFTGRSNLLEQGRRMGARIGAPFGNPVINPIFTNGAKFQIRVQGKCIE